jgi:four helix bundle protein
MSNTTSQKGRDDKPFDICQRTFQFAVRIVTFCAKFDQKPGVNWTMSKQLLRSGTSIGANIEEGQAGQSKPDFISKYSIARKEARETSYWLRLISATTHGHEAELNQLLDETGQLIKILTTIIKNARGS